MQNQQNIFCQGLTAVMNTPPQLVSTPIPQNSKSEDKSTASATLISINKEIKIRYKILTIFPHSTCKCETPLCFNKGKKYIQWSLTNVPSVPKRRQASFTCDTTAPLWSKYIMQLFSKEAGKVITEKCLSPTSKYKSFITRGNIWRNLDFNKHKGHLA